MRAGVDEDLIAAIDDPDRDTLSERERAAVDFALGFAGEPNAIGPETYDRLWGLFDEREVAEVTMLTMSFFSLGRLLETLARGTSCPLPNQAPTEADSDGR